MRKNFKKRVVLLATTAMLALSVMGCSSNGEEAQTPAPEKQTEQNTEETKRSEATDAAYLKAYFDVTVEDTVTAESFSAALKKVANDTAQDVEGDLTVLSAVKAAMKAADYEELVLSYPEEKVQDRLEKHGVSFEGEISNAAYLACAMDTQLISEELGAEAAKEDELSKEAAERLLMAVAEANGDARNYLGESDDPDIYAKIDQAWNSFILFDDGELSEIGRKSVQEGITTGYGLKSEAYSARFLPELTLQYGHSDIKHAHQLIGLLNSEDIKVKVQLEPKVSIYEYLLEWGDIPETTPTYEVKQFDDLYLVYAIEYDMQLEFENTEDMKRFDSVIKDYAKKNEGNEEAIGLIFGSWWQPLYSTVRTDMSQEDYHQIVDCVIKNGIYSIHPFCLVEDQEKVVTALEEISGDLKVEPVDRYCNTAFYNYMTGADYQ